MPFTPSILPTRFVPTPPPLREEASKKHLETEIRRLGLSLDRLVEAVKEIQEHLDTLP